MEENEIEVYSDERGNYQKLRVTENGNMTLIVWNEEEDRESYVDVYNLIKVLRENKLLD